MFVLALLNFDRNDATRYSYVNQMESNGDAGQNERGSS